MAQENSPQLRDAKKLPPLLRCEIEIGMVKDDAHPFQCVFPLVNLPLTLGSFPVIRRQTDRLGLVDAEDRELVGIGLDKGIEKNLDAALIQNKLHDNVKYDVKSGVVTLTGEVIS
jgi:hypothetical protein